MENKAKITTIEDLKLKNDIIKNIQRTTEDTLHSLDNFMILNTGMLTTEECIKNKFS